MKKKRVYYLDGMQLREKHKAHCYLEEILGLPSYYGHNADALMDCLTEIGEETDIHILHFEKILPVLQQVFGDAAEENPSLHLYA